MHNFRGNGFNGWDSIMDFGSRASAWFIIYDIVKLLIIVAVVIILARMFIKNSRDNKNSNSSSNKAIEILKERYASGEISEEEYEQRLKKLKE